MLCKEIMNRFLPSHWDTIDYGQVYTTVPLEKNSNEFKEIEREVLSHLGSTRYEVWAVQRIQHPFAFASFQIRKEHIKRLSRSYPSEMREFKKIASTAVNEYIRFNCDRRRITTNASSTNTYVVVMKTFATYQCTTNDANHYPEYMVSYRVRSTNHLNVSSLELGLSLLDI